VPIQGVYTVEVSPLLLLAFAALPLAALAQHDSYDVLVRAYDYDRKAPAHQTQTQIEKRGAVTLYEYSYDSPKGGRVPGYLLVPDGNGPFAVILCGHWMLKGSPMRNKKEFLEEAFVMARAGAVCLLLDSPYVRPGFVEAPDPVEGQGAHVAAQAVMDWRRALDLLLARPDVDKSRVAYVGHSFHAAVGARLAGIDKRIQSFVLMAGGFSSRELVFDPENADMVALRKKYGEERVRQYFDRFPWDDPVHFAKRSSPAAVFVQMGTKDKPLPERIARRDFAHFGEPKRLDMYDAGHELNNQATVDRATWLAQRLRLKEPDIDALKRIPQLH
jgi:cephalosporin-C deacetylase-like acetyl esterase